MDKEIKVPKSENRNKRIAIRISESEYSAINSYCKRKKVKKSALIRFLFSKVLPEII